MTLVKEWRNYNKEQLEAGKPPEPFFPKWLDKRSEGTEHEEERASEADSSRQEEM